MLPSACHTHGHAFSVCPDHKSVHVCLVLAGPLQQTPAGALSNWDLWGHYMQLGCTHHAGSLTLLVIRHDERTGRYRSQSGILEKYSNMNKIPEVSHSAAPHLQH